MNKEMKERYIKILCEDNTKEALAEDIILRDNRICEFRAWIDYLFSGTAGLTFYNTIEYLEKNKQFELANQLQEIHNYITTGSEFLRCWVKEEK